MAAVFADVCRKEGALYPGVGRSGVEVQFDYLRWRPDTDFSNVQCVVLHIFNLRQISMV